MKSIFGLASVPFSKLK